MSSRRARLAGVLVALLALLTATCTGDDGADSTTTTVDGPTESVLRLGVTDLGSLDPVEVVPTVHGQMMAAGLLYDSLTRVDPETGEIVGGLASDWEASRSLQGWTFDLTGATFSDDSPVTAADVKTSLERVAAPGPASLAGVRLEVIEGYQEFVDGETDEITGIMAVDDATVTVQAARPYAPMAELLATPLFGVVPAADADTAGFFDQPVGSGPAKLLEVGVPPAGTASSSVPARVLSFEILDPDTGVSTVELWDYETIGDSYAAFRAGDVDWSLVPGDELAAATDEYGDSAVGPFFAEVFYGMNLSSPTFAGRAGFRRAVVQAVDRQAIVDDVYAAAQLQNGVIAEGVPGHTENPCGMSCDTDPDAAEASLAEVFPDGDVPTVGIDFYEGEVERAAAEAIAADLEAVGIPTELRAQDFDTYREFVVSGDQELFLFGWVGISPTADSYLVPLFGSESADNVTTFSRADVDSTLGQARRTADSAERAEIYAGAEADIMSSVPILPLAQFQTAAVLSDRVQGWVPMLDGTIALEGLQISD